MFLTIVAYAIKFIILLFKVAIYIGCVIGLLIAIGAAVAAVIHVFPVVGIVLAIIAAIAVSYAIYRLVMFIKEKKHNRVVNVTDPYIIKRNKNENSTSQFTR